MTRTTEPTQSQSGTNQQPIDFSLVIASAVHDMKNSLGMVLHSLDELRQEYGDSMAGTERFNTLQYEAERVHSDLIQLLGIYRLGEEHLTAHVEEHFVPDFLAEQLARHVPLLEGHDIQYSITGDELNGFFDRDLLVGVLNNTINNAIRYTSGKLLLTAEERDGYLVIGVEDDGHGYPEAMQSGGSGAHNSLDFNTGSTSLGLFFAASVARLHTNGEQAGFIRLHNEGHLGGGTFEIWIP